jgi:ELWxxDGT repeat protein
MGLERTGASRAMIPRVRTFIPVVTALLALVPAAPAAAQDDLGLLKPLGTWTQPSDPADLVALADGTALFSADDAIHGRELWRTDGTAAGTRLVGDLVPGPEGSYPVAVEAVGDIAYFRSANTVWRTDGTAAGTRQLIDFTTASGTKARAAAAENEPVRQVFQPLGDGVLVVHPHRYGGNPELWHLRPSGAKKLELFDDPQLARQLHVSAAVDGKVLLTGTYSQYLTDGTRPARSWPPAHGRFVCADAPFVRAKSLIADACAHGNRTATAHPLRAGEGDPPAEKRSSACVAASTPGA